MQLAVACQFLASQSLALQQQQQPQQPNQQLIQ
jgi:hypothetical protein